MYVKALEIQGFKSFPDRTVLSFGEAITAIVGPNGSGKSNISDAVRWVMGEQSTRALRGGRMEDVIFGGTVKRRQTGYAQVSLILDNSGGTLPMEDSEVMVTRRYYRSGESEYYINRQSCRLRDINDLFMDTGLGREGYSIIGQGKIDEILSTRGQERRAVFEEAAGISRYRHRKEEAQRKLDRTQENLLRIGDKISELELQVEPLREQAERARQYLLLRDELRGLEISVWMDNLDRLRSGNRKLYSDYEQALRAREQAAAAQERCYQRSEELSAQLRQMEVQGDELRGSMTALQQECSERESALALLRSQVQHNEDSAQRLGRELDQQEGRADTVAEQIRQREQRLRELDAERQRLQEELTARQSDWERLEQVSRGMEQELEQLHLRQAEEDACAADAKARLSALSASAQELLDRDTLLQSQIQANRDRLAAARQEQGEKERELAEARAQAAAMENQLSGHRLRLDERQKRLTAATDRVNTLLMEDNNLNSRIHMISEMEKLYEGYSKAVKQVMQARERGQLQHICGTVGELLRVEGRYTVAMEIALGGGMQNIVVDRAEDGKRAIEYLKRREAGRATFLPVSEIRPAVLKERGLEDCPGFVGVASSLIRCEGRYEAVFSHLLGRVVICEDMDSAIAMARAYGHRFRIVTLDGQVLNPGGAMTGGSVSKSAGILSRAVELERLRGQAVTVREALEQAKIAMTEARRQCSEAQYELDSAQDRHRSKGEDILRLVGEAGQYQILTDALERQEQSYRQELAGLEQRTAQVEQDSRSASAEIADIEAKARSTRSLQQSRADQQGALRQQQEGLRQELSRLRTALAAAQAEERTAREALEQLQSVQRDLSGDRAARLEQLQSCQREIRTLTAEIAQGEAALSALGERQRAQQQQIDALTGERLALEGKRTQADREARERNEALLQLERDCSLLEQRKTAAVMEEKQLLDKLWDTYELSYDAAQKQRMELDSSARASRRIPELKRKIASLGNVNIGAVEEFQRVNQRYEYLTDQRDDVLKAKGELTGVIDGITAEMEKIFQRQFQAIGREFVTIFRELFGGGKAALELSDPKDLLNCDIEIKVQPPGKALKVLSLLSGGEKAFVAIALYFAFLKVRPAPFVVMDEIEAALDESNVVRFARYLRSMTAKTQFICITHRRGTMEEADVLYGVTMQERGVSKVLTLNLNDVERELGINAK